MTLRGRCRRYVLHFERTCLLKGSPSYRLLIWSLSICSTSILFYYYKHIAKVEWLQESKCKELSLKDRFEWNQQIMGKHRLVDCMEEAQREEQRRKEDERMKKAEERRKVEEDEHKRNTSWWFQLWGR
eukprot:GHVS01070347.1.p1 GENE.GHVS01070347.1~~GHVS01070347.1.p1  ORF type:complete len:128 (+),score=25.87 GHVS01070347.1:237-620(+)